MSSGAASEGQSSVKFVKQSSSMRRLRRSFFADWLFLIQVREFQFHIIIYMISLSESRCPTHESHNACDM